MKGNLRVVCLIAVQLAALLWAAAGAWAHAGEVEVASASHAFRLEDVTVSSTKMDKNLSTVTDSVTVIDEEQIRESGLTDLTDVLRFTPDIGFKRAGGPGQYVYTNVRGFNDGHFSVVIDGMKINESMSAGTGHLFSKLDPFLMQRIEILRGPQAALYGSDTTAGVIAFTTKGGLPGHNGAVGVEYGSLDWMKAYAGLRGQEGGLRYSLNVAQVDSGGVVEHEDFQNFSPQIKLGYNWGDRLDVEASYLHIQSKWNYAYNIENYGFCKSRSDWYAFQVGDPERYNKETYDLATLNVKQKLSDEFRQKIMLGWYQKETESANPYNGLLGYITSPADYFTLDYYTYYKKGIPVPVYDDGNGKPYWYRDQNVQADYNLIWDKKLAFGHNTALLGLEWLNKEGKKWGLYGEADGRQETRSAYLNDQLLLMDKALALSAGLRMDDHQDFSDEATWKAGAAYTFKSLGSTLFANYGTSFRTPTITNLYDPQYGNAALTPEKGWTVEGGLRQDLLGKRLHLELTAWHTELTDAIAFEYTTMTTGHYVNRDEQHTQGVELAFDWDMGGGFTLLGNYAYTDSQSAANGVWERTVLVARNIGSLGLQRSFSDKLVLGAQVFMVGPRLRWKGDLESDEYLRVDLYGRYNFHDGLSAYCRVNNLFDSDIEESMEYEQPGLYLVAGLSWDFSLAK